MPTLDDVKKALHTLENGSDLYETVASAILQERNHGKSRVQDAETRASRAVAALKAIGYDPDNQDVDSFAISLKDRLQNSEKTGEKLSASEKRMRDLENNYSALMEKLGATEKKASTFENNYKREKIGSKLLTALEKQMYGADAYTKLLISEGRVTLDESNKVVWKNGDSILPFEEGLEAFKKEHPQNVRNAQNPGPGTKPSDETAPNKVMARSAFDRSTPADRMSFIKSGGKVVD